VLLDGVGKSPYGNTVRVVVRGARAGREGAEGCREGRGESVVLVFGSGVSTRDAGLDCPFGGFGNVGSGSGGFSSCCGRP